MNNQPSLVKRQLENKSSTLDAYFQKRKVDLKAEISAENSLL
jgi:hypothetical protein